MIRYLTAAVAALALLAAPAAAQADPGKIPVASDCNTGWFVNQDEGDYLPEQKPDGFAFAGKDLVHHDTALLDFDAVDKTSKSFVATEAGKVVFKMETGGDGPYSTIVVEPTGKVWSTAFKPEAVGGISNPVDKLTDLIGKPDAMKAGKVPYTAASRVKTFGVGYYTETGTTVVSAVTFHGHTYSLKCAPKPSPSTSSPTATPTATKPTTTPATTRPPTSPTSSPVPGAGTGDGGTSTGEGLPVTGSSAGVLAAWASAVLLIGAGLFVLARRRRNRFVA